MAPSNGIWHTNVVTESIGLDKVFILRSFSPFIVGWPNRKPLLSKEVLELHHSLT